LAKISEVSDLHSVIVTIKKILNLLFKTHPKNVFIWQFIYLLEQEVPNKLFLNISACTKIRMFQVS